MPPQESFFIDFCCEVHAWIMYDGGGRTIYESNDPVSTVMWGREFIRLRNIGGGNCTIEISDCAKEAFKATVSKENRPAFCARAGVSNYEKVSD